MKSVSMHESMWSTEYILKKNYLALLGLSCGMWDPHCVMGSLAAARGDLVP